MEQLPKILGSDIELGNFVLGMDKVGGTGREASRLLLRCMPGVMPACDFGGFNSAWSSGAAGSLVSQVAYEPPDPRDFGRKWMRNGGCCYVDSDHLELAAPETTNAWDWAAAFYAQLMIVREAQRRASEELADGSSLQVLVCNSDGCGSSWGSHINVLITRRAFLNIFGRRMHHLLWLASYQASSVIIGGLGKVGSEREGLPADYQLSQRADFFEEIVSHSTMERRPIINARDEPHCYPPSEFARFHHIACDSNLCPVANVLKVGVLQVMLAMVEAQSDLIGSSVLLESPIDAWIAFSRDPTLRAMARTIDGTLMSALDLQRRLFHAAARFQSSGGCDGIVPRAGEILELWSETLDMLAERDWQRLSGRLDWVLKQRMIEQAFDTTPGLTWQSPEAKYLDLMYSSLLPEDGLFWPCLDSGIVEQIVDPQAIERFKTAPPEDTRAFTRGHLIRGRGDYRIESADWDSLRIRFSPPDARYPSYGRGQVFMVYTDTPFGSTRQVNPDLPRTGKIQIQNIPADISTAGIARNKEPSTCNSKNMSSKRLPK